MGKKPMMSISECIRWESHGWLCPGTLNLHPTCPTGEHAGSPGAAGWVRHCCLARPCSSAGAEGDPAGPPEYTTARDEGSRKGHRASLGPARRRRTPMGSEAAGSRAQPVRARSSKGNSSKILIAFILPIASHSPAGQHTPTHACTHSRTLRHAGSLSLGLEEPGCSESSGKGE